MVMAWPLLRLLRFAFLLYQVTSGMAQPPFRLRMSAIGLTLGATTVMAWPLLRLCWSSFGLIIVTSTVMALPVLRFLMCVLVSVMTILAQHGTLLALLAV